MANDLLKVEIRDNDILVGTVTPDEFRSYFGAKNAFLQELVNKYNLAHEHAKSPMRASIHITQINPNMAS